MAAIDRISLSFSCVHRKKITVCCNLRIKEYVTVMVEVDLAGFVGIITLLLLYNFIPDPIMHVRNRVWNEVIQ